MKTSPNKRDNTEVQAARGRLRGALNDSLQNQEVDDIPEDYDEEEEEEEEQEEEERQIVPHRQRGRPKKIQADRLSPSAAAGFLTPSKRRKREHHQQAAGSGGQKIQAESFVMKLFDRSLDLSKYSEQTSLYPICRAWMANQPRNPSIRSYRDARSPSPTERKDNGLELLAKLRKGDMREVCSMPKPRKTDVPKIPPPAEEPKKYTKSQELVAADNELKDGCKEELLAQHLGKWKKVKVDWQKHTKVYQKRHEVSYQILELLFKP